MTNTWLKCAPFSVAIPLYVPHILKLHNQRVSNRVKVSNVGRTDFHTPPTQAPIAVIFVTIEALSS